MKSFVLVCVVAVFLSGCAATAPDSSADPVATETPAGETMLDAAAAWELCEADIVASAAATEPPTTGYTLNKYSPAFASEEDGAFRSQLVGALGQDDGEAAFCVYSGTVENPVELDYLHLR